MKILLVDDNEDTLTLMKNALKADEYEIFTATHGEQAIEITDKERPDVILLDVMMPDMDGFTVCKKIHFCEKNKNIPILMVTAKNDIKDLVNGLESGAIDYIKKPFNNIELSARVKAALKLKEATDELIKEKQKAALIEMAAAVAHNLNQPLSGMILNIQYIQSIIKKDPHPELCEDINDKLKTLISLVDDMTNMIRKIGRIANYYTMPYVKDVKIIDIDKSSL